MPLNDIQNWIEIKESLKMLYEVSWVIAAAFFAVIIWAAFGRK